MLELQKAGWHPPYGVYIQNKEIRDMEEAFNPGDLLFVGTFGHVRAIDKQTGEDRWQISLPATGYETVSA